MTLISRKAVSPAPHGSPEEPGTAGEPGGTLRLPPPQAPPSMGSGKGTSSLRQNPEKPGLACCRAQQGRRDAPAPKGVPSPPTRSNIQNLQSQAFCELRDSSDGVRPDGRKLQGAPDMIPCNPPAGVRGERDAPPAPAFERRGARGDEKVSRRG